MAEADILLNPNPVVRFLNKPPELFTRDDIIRFIEENGIEMLNFRYVAEDGKLKTLNFVITSKKHLESILSDGERIDGSQMFSFIEAGASDLYVIPRYRTAFINPFADVPTLDILCSFYASNGRPLENAPEYMLRKAHEAFRRETGCTFKALGELEYYVISEKEALYPGIDQKGYHASEPFAKWEGFRNEALRLVAQAGGKVKYGHSEVGCFTDDSRLYEQHEIEFLPVPVEDAVDQLVIAKWILRMLGYRYGVEVSFAPKITVGKAGSGMHFHMMVERDGRNIMVEDGVLSDTARKMIAGILDLAAALTAFGNTIPISYLRLVPHQEAPTKICWGDRNRSVAVRVPLGWVGASGMICDANNHDCIVDADEPGKQTIEFRVPDGSAEPYTLVAGLVVASLHGIRMSDGLKRAEELYVSGNISGPEYAGQLARLHHLPGSCYESAEALEAVRACFEKDGIFPKGMIDARIQKLKAFNDRGLSERILSDEDAVRALVKEYLHVM
ncbi:glutamine synthetase type i [hydrocarbon metagenome]|uniref:Glutamine synthetase type i n=1 Tax=hydrocarbon metagenome TaxID=938273 RepID=A0A0W8FED1_9ZZZZ|nr:glutamine synthetase family protein [Methanomicrobiaceae archaeon]